MAGVAKVDITDREAGPVNDPLYVKALVLQSGQTKFAIVTVDAVAVGEIGHISNEYLPAVRAAVKDQVGIPPANVMVNASHCHGVVCADVADRTVQAIEQAASQLVPVKIGTGSGHEDRVMENRRLFLNDGTEVDVRHAYSLPPDEAVAKVGPVDTQIGVLRLDRMDGSILSVVYNFACHPIQGVPSGANTADMIGFASKVIEENTGDETLALFLQGCGGDINPVMYKDVEHPRDAEPLGNLLGLSTLRAVREIECKEDSRLVVRNQQLTLPRRDPTARIFEMEKEQKRLLNSLNGTSLDLKAFLALTVKYNLSEQFPSYASHRYLHDEQLGRDDFRKLDALNRKNLQAYIRNIHAMEELTRVNTNLRLLRKHQRGLIDSGKRTVDVELTTVRIGDLVLTTFPGELTVQIGLNIKKASPHPQTLVAGYTNGYIYYAPTAKQLENFGGAQEDSDCILAPEWQALYEAKAAEMLQGI